MRTLKDIFKEIQQLTFAKCRTHCQTNFECCTDLQCSFVEKALKKKGIHIDRIKDALIRFMGDTGCTVPPHLRPTCSIYLCQHVKSNTHLLFRHRYGLLLREVDKVKQNSRDNT